MRTSGLRAREADGDSSRCAYDCDGHAGHHRRRREHLLGSFTKGLFERGARVRDVDGEAAARRLGRISLANPAAALLGVRKQVVLAAVGHGETRLERPAQNLGAPGLGRCRVAAGELGMRDPTVEAPRRHVTRRRRPRGFRGGPALR